MPTMRTTATRSRRPSGSTASSPRARSGRRASSPTRCRRRPSARRRRRSTRTSSANVSANQIMLYAPHGSVGNSAAPQTFTFTSVNSSSLTPEQRGLLATAGPGQLTVGAVTDPTTHVMTYTVSLSQQNLVVVDNPIAISAKALTNIYLGSKNSLTLGGITANYGPIAAAQANGIEVTGRGDVKLDAVNSITAAAGVTGSR